MSLNRSRVRRRENLSQFHLTNPLSNEWPNMPRYPYIATEVLCCEIWSIVDTCVNEQQQLLVPFWEIVLDKSPDEMKTQTTMASHFAKVNSFFMTKKPAEVSRGFFGDSLIKIIKHSPFLNFRCWNSSKPNLQSSIVYLDISNCLLL